MSTTTVDMAAALASRLTSVQEVKSAPATITNEQKLMARIAELEAKLETKSVLSLKVSEKGALSVYGLQRMPVTLYAGQWERLLGAAEGIRKFIAANPTLARK